jgi:LysM repeat protein
MKNVTHITIHYSATFEDPEIGVREIRPMHIARGFRKEGYHYIIRLNGVIEKGREEWEVGAHVAGKNVGNIGICWIGGLRRSTGANKGVDTRTPAQTAALIKLIRELLGRYPGAKVVGHRDLGATQCPGFDVGAWWASVNGAQAPIAAPVAPTAPVRTPDISEDRVHTVVAGETWFSIARTHGLSLADIFALNGTNAGHVIHPGEKLRVFAGSPEPAPVIPRNYPPLSVEPAPAPSLGFWQRILNWFRA